MGEDGGPKSAPMVSSIIRMAPNDTFILSPHIGKVPSLTQCVEN